MARFLRQINAPRWYTTGKHLKWLPAGAIQGNALRDLGCKDNKISLFSVATDIELRDTVAALAAGMNPAAFSYALIEEGFLEDFLLTPKIGETIDNSVNSRHVDLVRLTCADVLRLAQVVVDSERVTADKDDVIAYVAENFAGGKFIRRPENANWDRYLIKEQMSHGHVAGLKSHAPSTVLSGIRHIRDQFVDVLMRI